MRPFQGLGTSSILVARFEQRSRQDSAHRPHPAERPPAMAVRTHDLALLDLDEDAPPVPVRQGAADVELPVAHVVELEDERVAFPASTQGRSEK